MPPQNFLICSVQRSGTHLLCDVLKQTGSAGSPDEFFLVKEGHLWEWMQKFPSREAFLKATLSRNTSANGVFGAVVMWNYFPTMVARFQEMAQFQHLDTAAQVMDAVFSKPRYIWLTRRDHIRQAVSWSIAIQTNVYMIRDGKSKQAQAAPRFDYKEIKKLHATIQQSEAAWEQFFRANDIQPLHLVYEEIVSALPQAAERILTFIGAEITENLPAYHPSYAKQSNDQTQAWANEFNRLENSRNPIPRLWKQLVG